MPPSRNNNSAPPPRMTWGRALPVLAVCIVFDFIRIIFEWFFFFGPALAAVACTIGVNSVIGTSVAEVTGKVVTGACVAGAGVLGFFGSGAIETFGIIMAMAVGLLGWGTVVLLLAILNPRIWKSNVWAFVWSILGFGISEVPLLGTLPMLTITHVRLYAAQIKKDKEALKHYQEEQGQVAAAVARSAQQQRFLEQAQVFQQEAANDEQYEQAEEEIPDEVRRAA